MNNDNYIVYYINLDECKEPNKHIKEELENIFDKDKINRFSAIKEENGAIGLAKSVVQILKNFMKTNKKNLFIFEDDFQLEIKPKKAKKILNECLTLDFNLISLSYNCKYIDIQTNVNKYTCFAKNVQMTSGFLVRRNFVPKLIEVWEESILKMTNKNTHIYAIDQAWKCLQERRNKFYITKIRLGKQRVGYSSIEKKYTDYGSSCFIIILGCKKYMHKIKKHRKQMINSNFNYRYFIGNPNIKEPKEENDIIYLPCGDNYEDLSDKTYNSLLWVRKNFPQIDYVLKTDDDTILYFQNIYKLFQKMMKNKCDYVGNGISIDKKHQSEYHFGKCKDKTINKTAYTLEKINYCSGGCYFLSRKSMDIIFKDFNKYKNIFEDYSIGLTLHKNRIKVSRVKNIKKYIHWD
jgi:GR25 family glycosyltransferase involved in LPS biosynthesis